MNKNKHYRQGDVLIIPVATIPKNLVRTKRITLALGEVTGHHHRIETVDGAIGYAPNNDDLAEYIHVMDENVELRHEEHEAIILPKGKYRKVIQTEYVAVQIQNVKD